MTNLDNARYWCERAEEARVRAEQMRSPEAKRQMFEIASSYEVLAKRAEERAKGKPEPLT